MSEHERALLEAVCVFLHADGVTPQLQSRMAAAITIYAFKLSSRLCNLVVEQGVTVDRAIEALDRMMDLPSVLPTLKSFQVNRLQDLDRDALEYAATVAMQSLLRIHEGDLQIDAADYAGRMLTQIGVLT